MKRRTIREYVLKALFACEMEKGDPFRQFAYIADDLEMAGYEDGEEAPLSDGDCAYAKRLLAGVSAQQVALDEMIDRYAVDWDVGRIGGVERNILRLGFYEMLFDEKLPPAIAINEAVDLMKKFGAPEGAKFVNGILDNLPAIAEGGTESER